MKVYAVRKRAGQWSVCSEGDVVLHFDSYEQAIETARTAIGVLAKVHEEAAAKLRDDAGPQP